MVFAEREAYENHLHTVNRYVNWARQLRIKIGCEASNKENKENLFNGHLRTGIQINNNIRTNVEITKCESCSADI